MDTQNNNKNIESPIRQEPQAPEILPNQQQGEHQKSQEPGFSLVVRNMANNVETRHTLEEGKEVIVGASPECSILVSDDYISGKHFSVRVHNGKVEVTDLGSTNGLYLRLEGPVEVLPGQKLMAGKTIFSLEGAGDELKE